MLDFVFELTAKVENTLAAVRLPHVVLDSFGFLIDLLWTSVEFKFVQVVALGLCSSSMLTDRQASPDCDAVSTLLGLMGSAAKVYTMNVSFFYSNT